MPEKPKILKQHEDTALSLSQLIGAPLHALIYAEKQAADATAGFIKSVGFEPDVGSQPAPGSAQSPLDAGGEQHRLGAMRMAAFRRTLPDGTVHRIEVPFLSLVPIPALQIKQAEIEFAVKVIDTIPLRPANGGPPGTGLAPPIDVKGAVGRPIGQGSRQSETQMKVKITVQQADVPGGLARLFNLMDEQVSVLRRSPLAVKPSSVVVTPRAPAKVEVSLVDEWGDGRKDVAIVAEPAADAPKLDLRMQAAVTDAQGVVVFEIALPAEATVSAESTTSILFRAKVEGAERTARLAVKIARTKE